MNPNNQNLTVSLALRARSTMNPNNQNPIKKCQPCA